ncbi:hypothetical protein H8E06_01125 [bacterium]|nr:hypothetical protein [bacterium]
MPKQGDYISLRDDIDPGRGTSGRNRLSDPKGGQTAFSDYTGGEFGGIKIQGHHNKEWLRSSEIQFLNEITAEVVIKSLGRRQQQIFGDPRQWDWAVLDHNHNPLDSVLSINANQGHKSTWQCIYNTPAAGQWVRLSARYKDVGGINNHITGITDVIHSAPFRVCGAEVPHTNIWTKGEDGFFASAHAGYGLNNGQFRIRVSSPSGLSNRYTNPTGSAFGKLSFYAVNIYHPQTKAHLGGINVKPDTYGWIYTINSGGSDGGTSEIAWTVTGYDVNGKVMIPTYGSTVNRPSFKPVHAAINYAHQVAGSSWEQDWNADTQRSPNM